MGPTKKSRQDKPTLRSCLVLENIHHLLLHHGLNILVKHETSGRAFSKMASQEKEHPALSLLARAHSPTTSNQIFKEKIRNRPLLLRPSSPDPKDDARTKRQKATLQKAASLRKSKKPRPLTAKQKRALGIYEIPKDQQKYAIYEPIHRLWCGYIREILGLDKVPHVNPAGAGPMLPSADFHGAMLEVVRNRCVGRVGIKGIVVKDTKFTFEIITPKNELKSMYP